MSCVVPSCDTVLGTIPAFSRSGIQGLAVEAVEGWAHLCKAGVFIVGLPSFQEIKRKAPTADRSVLIYTLLMFHSTYFPLPFAPTSPVPSGGPGPLGWQMEDSLRF